MEAPKGLIPFNKLDLCQPYHNQLKIITGLSVGISIIGVTTSIFGGFNWLIIPVCITISILIFLVFGLDTWALINTPLGVNMNHPFVDDEPIGKALVYVRFTSNEWHEMGQHRVRLVADNLIGGYNLVEDYEDYNSIGHFSKSSKKSRLTKQVIIINQALGLRDVVNGDDDPINDARERESMDYGLLERNWLEEEELSVDGPLAKFIKKE
jgi:hypothetical protein